MKKPEETIKHYYRELIAPKEITHETLEKTFRKALRLRIWKKLNPLKRALLYVAKKTITTQVRNPTLKQILTQIIIEIDKHTFKGKALYYGLIIALNRMKILGTKILRNLTALLYLGISYLNESPIYQNLNLQSHIP